MVAANNAAKFIEVKIDPKEMTLEELQAAKKEAEHIKSVIDYNIVSRKMIARKHSSSS